MSFHAVVGHFFPELNSTWGVSHFIFPPTERHFSCFQVLTVLNGHVHSSLQV